MVQWLRIHLAKLGTPVQFLVQEDASRPGVMKPAPQILSQRSSAHETQLLSPRTATAEVCRRRASAPRDKLPQWEACITQWRVAPLAASRENPNTTMKMRHSQQINPKKYILKKMVLEVLANTVRKGNKRYTDVKEDIKLSLFSDDMIIYIENLKKLTNKTPETNKWLQQGCRRQG